MRSGLALIPPSRLATLWNAYTTAVFPLGIGTPELIVTVPKMPYAPLDPLVELELLVLPPVVPVLPLDVVPARQIEPPSGIF
jgi:hypothetical protein